VTNLPNKKIKLSRTAISNLETILVIAVIIVAGIAGYFGYVAFTPAPSPIPGEFELSNLVISESEIMEGAAVDVSVNVTNTGESSVTGPITLSLNGKVQETKSLTLEAEEEQKVEFTVATSTGDSGDYSVLVGALSGEFSVRAPIKISWLAPISLQIPAIASEMQFDEEFGIKLELVKMARSSDAMNALLAGELDITFAAFSTVKGAFLQGAKVQGSMIAYYGGYKYAIVTMNTTGISTVADLENKTVAVPGLGAPPELFVRAAANKSGIDPDSINFIQLALDVIGTAVATGEVDAGMLFEPILTGFMSNVPGVVLITRGTGLPIVNYGPSGYFMQEDFIKNNNELAYKIFLTLAKAQWYIRTQGPDSDEILSILSETTGIPIQVFRPSANMNVWDPRLKPCELAAEWDQMEFFVAAGKLGEMVPTSNVWYQGLYDRARIEHPELFADLDDYLEALKTEGIVTDIDFITDFNEYLEATG
jgi:NitT/TauT family transport system substrate-binding protein